MRKKMDTSSSSAAPDIKRMVSEMRRKKDMKPMPEIRKLKGMTIRKPKHKSSPTDKYKA